MRHATACFVLLLTSALAYGAPPATQPAPKADPTMAVVEFEKLGFRLSVPKVWKQAAKSENSATFQLPGGGFVVLAGKSARDLGGAVEDKKNFLAKNASGLKYTKDEATTLGGHPAWLLVYDVQTTARQVDPKTGKDVPNAQPVAIGQRALAVTAVKDGVLVQLTFVCGDKSFQALSKLGQKAISTFEWTTPTQPAEEKK
jgi:hypothetical protein